MKYLKYLYTVFSLPSKLTIFTPDNLKHPYKDVTVPVVAGVSAVSSVSFWAGAHVSMLQIQRSAFLTSGSVIRIQDIKTDPGSYSRDIINNFLV
jgi:hypothetical protein